MKSKCLILLGCSLLLFLSVVSQLGYAQGSNAINFESGQVWSIKSSTLSLSKVIIGRIEPLEDRKIVHIAIIDVPVPQARAGASAIRIDHVPIYDDALSFSVDRIIATEEAPPPNFELGYAAWKAANGGVYTISVENIIGLTFRTLNIQRGNR